MNKRFLSPLLVAAFACSTAGATELHAPLPGQQGPLRYEFEKVGKNKLGFNFWTVGYQREADKAFLKHGTNTEPYTALIFGKGEFKIAESFENGRDSDYYTEYRNPYLDSAKVAPRASYTDRGLVVGASVAYPVWKDKGHVGLRASIPFRNMRVEKDDEMEHIALGTQDKVIRGGVRFVNPQLNTAGEDPAGDPATEAEGIVQAGANGDPHLFGQLTHFDAHIVPVAANNNTINKTMRNISAYNLKFLNNVKYLEGGVLRTLFDYVRSQAGVNAAPAAVAPGAAALTTQANHAGDNNQGSNVNLILIKAADTRALPYDKIGALLVDTANIAPDIDTFWAAQKSASSLITYVEGNNTVRVGACAIANAADAVARVSGMTVAAEDWDGAGETTARVFNNNRSNNIIAPAVIGVYHATYNRTTIPETLWVTTVHGSTGSPIDTSARVADVIDNALLLYNVDLTSFLTQRGYSFQTYEETGLGDTDLDLFYQHNFSDKWTGELYAGVRFPTGETVKYTGNPYKTNLGNGGHFEIKLGGKLGWDLFKHISVKADASYSFVLNATEHRMAAFKDATIKNFGPRADADVDWSYFTGNFDVTLYHPKSHDISTTLGYELYYKTEDKISFKDTKSTTHMLGKVWGADATHPATVGGVAGVGYFDYSMDLSNAVARKNTESIAHRGHVEGHYNFSKYLGLFVGGKYTFAGQNTPREGEAYGGFNVKF